MAGVKGDKGWAWVVSFGCFMATFWEVGIVKALGVLLPSLREQFASQTWIIGLVISFVPGIGAITCPLAGALCKHFTARPTLMVFGLLSSLGLITGSLATSVPMLLLSFVLAGFSIGAECIAMGEIATYFPKKYSIAYAIALTGLSFGVMVIPPLTQLFINTYGWRGAMLLLGGINLHVVVSGALFRPIIPEIKNSVIKIPSARARHKTIPQKQNPSIYTNLAYHLDLALFQDALFVSLFLYAFGNGYYFTGWLIYLVTFAEDVGFPSYKATALSSYGGVGYFFGNMLFPLLTRRFSSHHIVFCFTLIALSALLFYPLFAKLDTYSGLICTSVVFGCAKAVSIACAYTITKEYIEKDRLTNAVMWRIVANSAGAVLSGFLSGWIYDQTGSFTLSFVILSGVSLLSVCPLTIFAMRRASTK